MIKIKNYKKVENLEEAWELNQKRTAGDYVLLTPGNYGSEFIRGEMGLDMNLAVQTSNFIGDSLDTCRSLGFSGGLLIGHIGKLVKLAGGIVNTHSRWADGRAELFCAHAALCGADRDTAQALMDSATADQCLSVLERAGLREPVMDSLLEAVQRHLERRAAEQFSVGAVLFSNQYGLLGMIRGAKEILEAWQTS